MKRNTLIAVALILSTMLGFLACVDKTPTNKEPVDAQELTKNQEEVHGTMVTADDVQLTTPLNAQWVSQGKGIYDMKCQSCHKLTAEKVVGPGWQGVTTRRKPEWILNMITNVDMMLASDPEAQKLLEQCLVRMPNQNLTLDEARRVLEFMRNNDGEK